MRSECRRLCRAASMNRAGRKMLESMRTQRADRAIQAAGDVHRVSAVLRRNHQDHRRPAADRGGANPRCRAFGHVRNLAEGEVRAILLEDHRAGQPPGASGLSFALKSDPLIRGCHESRAANTRGLTGGCQHLVHSDPVLRELLGIDLHLVLLFQSAEHGDLRDPRNSQQPQLHRPVGHRAQIHERNGGRGQADSHHNVGRGGERRDHGADACRKRTGQGGETLTHHLPVQIDVRIGVEQDGDHGQALSGGRADRLDPGDTADRILDRLCCQQLDLLRRQAGGLRGDDHLRRREFREDVVLGLVQRIHAVEKQRAGEGHDHPAMPQ
jgi:hypothetical protein